MSFALVAAYAADERTREKGEAVAASRLQAFGRGIIARRKIQEVWQIAQEQFDREEVCAISRNTAMSSFLNF